MTRRYCLFLVSAAALAQIARPRVGYNGDRSGALRPVEGVAGAFTLGPPIDHNVVSVAFSGKTLVIKKERQLIVDGKPFESPGGPAVISFTSTGHLKDVFFPEVGILWTPAGDTFDEAYASDPQDATAIRDGDLTVRGVPVRLKSRVQRFSRMSEDWLVAYAEDRIYAIRDGQALELPEDNE